MRSDGVEDHRSDAPRTCRTFLVGILSITWWRMRVHFWNFSQKRCSVVLSRSWCVDRVFQRLSICLRIYSLVEYGTITIPTPSVSSDHPTATLYHMFYFLYDTWLDNLFKSMSRLSLITHLVIKEVHSMKEDVQLPNSRPVLLLPQHSNDLVRKLYYLAFPLFSLAFPSLQHQHSVGT